MEKTKTIRRPTLRELEAYRKAQGGCELLEIEEPPLMKVRGGQGRSGREVCFSAWLIVRLSGVGICAGVCWGVVKLVVFLFG